jgi:hypothetical protein
MENFTRSGPRLWLMVLAIAISSLVITRYNYLESSSHREAPLISNDPLADNTDVYAFRNPAKPGNMIIIANYIPFEAPHGGPNYFNFGENIAYDIHIKNNATTKKDDITYRFEFALTDEDPTTFFNIRLGKQNQKATYTCKKSTDGGSSWTTIISNGVVPPNNIGPRSIEGEVGLKTNYEALMNGAIMTANSGEKVFCGPVDDPFFVDLGGIFDIANVRPANAVDGLRKLNVHSIALDIPIALLQKDGKAVSDAKNILDPDYVIGVWASASRRKMKVLEAKGVENHSGDWVQVSRLGMPLTNEVIIPLGRKDEWNYVSSSNDDADFEQYFTSPEVALYMDDSKFGGAVPGLSLLRIQSKSLGKYDFRNGHDGLFPLLGNKATAGTALDTKLFGNYLLRDNNPRSLDLLPIFLTGVPNLPPYQLMTGKKAGNPLALGKPFIHNFLPTFGDMLRVNMAVPVTDRSSADFSSEGLLQAAVLGLTDARYNSSKDLQFIPNMDGFPNGRRLEDDVTRIELQAASGIVLAVLGLGYDDYTPVSGTTTVCAVKRGSAIDFTNNLPKGATVTDIVSATYGSGTGTNCGNFVYGSCQVDLKSRLLELSTLDPADLDPQEVLAFITSLGNICPGTVNSLQITLSYQMPGSLATQDLVDVLTFRTGIEKNDAAFQTKFPFLQKPWEGFKDGAMCDENGVPLEASAAASITPFAAPASMNMAPPAVLLQELTPIPNPARNTTTFRYRVPTPGDVTVTILDARGHVVATPQQKQSRAAGVYDLPVNVSKLENGIYYARVQSGAYLQTIKFVVSNN